MIEIKQLAAQGDVVFRRIDRLPSNAVERKVTGPIVVAHSETGHHHAIHDAGVRLFETVRHDAMVRYLSVDGASADVVHHRAEHTHQTLRLLTGVWEVRRQRQWVPDPADDAAWVAVAD